MLLPGLAAMNGFCGATVAGIGRVAAVATDVPAASAQSASAAERRRIWAGVIKAPEGAWFVVCMVRPERRRRTCAGSTSRRGAHQGVDSARLVPPPRSPALVALAGAVAAACTFVLVAGSDVLAQPRLSAWVRAGFVVATVGGGAYTWRRRPASGFGPLLALAGLLFAVTSLNALAAPLAFTLGRVNYAAVMLALVYVCLSFPRGGPGSSRDRRFVVALGAAEALLWAAVLALAAELPAAGPFAACAAACPENALRFVDGAAGVGHALGTVANAVSAAAFVAVAGVLLARMRGSDRAARRTFAPLFAALGAVLVSLAAYTLAQEAFDARPAVLSAAVAAAVLLVPAAIVAGQVRGRLFAARRLGSLVADAPVDVERLIGDALGDPTVTLARWNGEGYRDLEGHPVAARRARGEVELTRDGRPYALVRYDAALGQPPDVVRGLAAAGLMVLDNARLPAPARGPRAPSDGAAPT